MPAMKVTGERVASPEGGFNPTWQRHVAAYMLSEPHLHDGRVLDLGCGVGHSFHLLAPRETVGVDIDAGALEGQERETVVADMRELPFADGSFPSVLSVQSLEHVPDPDRVIAEACRVLTDDGVAVFVTPNRLTLGRPDEIIDPYHYVEFDPTSCALSARERFERGRDPRDLRLRALHGDLRRGAGDPRQAPRSGSAAAAQAGADESEAEAVRPDAEPLSR